MNKDEKRLIDQFREYLSDLIGLHSPPEKRIDFEKRMALISRRLGFNSLSQCYSWMQSNPLSSEQLELLVDGLTVGETYFFRDLGNFQLLEEIALPQCIKAHEKDKKLKIWSAACCTGEEIYSIAILLDRKISDLNEWDLTLLGTDINTIFLEKAAQGTYRDWAFRKIDPFIKKRYFHQETKGVYAISSEIKKRVSFSNLNLVGNSLYPVQGPWDIIFCCNVLIYFSPAQIKKVVNRLTDSLSEGGWLFVSPVEVPFIQHPKLIPINRSHSVSFRKESINKKLAIADSRNTGKVHSQWLHKSDVHLDKKEMAGIGEPHAAFSKLIELESVPIVHAAYEECLKDFESGRYDQVITKLEKKLEKIEVNPDLFKKHMNETVLLIRAYANLKNQKKALEWCDKAFKVEKLSPLLYYLQATLLQESGFVDDAIEALRKTLFLDSHFVMAHFLLGHLLLSKQNVAKAISSFKNSLRLLKDYPKESVLPWSDGMQAGSLVEIINSTLENI